jgi:CheY-like chemotaxis protein
MCSNTAALLYDFANTRVEKFMPAIKVLAVDDNEMHCYALRRILEHSGFEVFIASSGSDALSIARDCRPDVVLLDINLPDVSGYDVCSQLKQDEVTRRIPVVFHTATEATGPARSYAESVGASGFLTYPIDGAQLASVLQGAAARAHGVSR